MAGTCRGRRSNRSATRPAVDVDDVVAALADLAASGGDATGREGGEVGDGAVRDPHRATERDQVEPGVSRGSAAALCSTRLSLVRRVERSQHADAVATIEELFGKRLDVPVHAALVCPGIWRNEGNAHGSVKVTAGLVARLGPGKPRESQQECGADLQQQGAG